MHSKDKGSGSVIEAGSRNTTGLMGVQGDQSLQPERLTQTQASIEAPGAPIVPGNNTAWTAAGGEKENWQPLLRFEGRGWAYFGLLLRNLLLSLVTLGVYSFWGRTRQRQYLWGHTLLLGEPLEYTGTGKELFISFLIVMPALLVIMFLGGIIAVSIGPGAELILYFPLLLLWQFASYRALRFRLTRTRWRGIRGNLGGSAIAYAFKASGYFLLIIVSLGILYPWASARVVGLILNNVWFGNRQLSFSGLARELYKSYFLCFLCCIGVVILAFIPLVAFMLMNPEFMHDPDVVHSPLISFVPLAVTLLLILGFAICTTFYRAAFFRWLFRHASFGRVRTRSTLSGGQLFKITVLNIFQVLFTLGFGATFAFIRLTAARLNSVQFQGDPQLDVLLQDTKSVPKTGEGLLEALDVDIAF